MAEFDLILINLKTLRHDEYKFNTNYLLIKNKIKFKLISVPEFE